MQKLSGQQCFHADEVFLTLESGRKKVEVKQGAEESFGREAGAHFVPDQKREEQDLLGLAEWRKKMLRRMG